MAMPPVDDTRASACESSATSVPSNATASSSTVVTAQADSALAPHQQNNLAQPTAHLHAPHPASTESREAYLDALFYSMEQGFSAIDDDDFDFDDSGLGLCGAAVTTGAMNLHALTQMMTNLG